MKKPNYIFTLLTISLLTINLFTYSQGCLPEGIIFTTQQEIDDFQINYPGCTAIEGDVEINGDNIINLNGLNIISSMEKDLVIGYNPKLKNLNGLESLSVVEGNLIIYSCDSIVSFEGLINLIEIGGKIFLDDNPQFVNFSGLENLTTIGDDLFVQYTNLESFIGLDNLETIGVDLNVFSNPSLTTFEGMNNLETIGGFLRIYDNTSLISLQDLSSLTSTKGFAVAYNTSLTSVSGLDNINPDTISGLIIKDNLNLATCEVMSMCDYLVSPNGTVEIENNAFGCNSPEEVEEACVTCLPEGIIFTTQQQIDNFQTNKTVQCMIPFDNKIFINKT